MKSLPFREKKAGEWVGREPAKWTTLHFLKDSSACKMVLFKRGKSWVFKSLVKDQ